MTTRDLILYMLVGIAWWLYENWWVIPLVVGLVIVIQIVRRRG